MTLSTIPPAPPSVSTLTIDGWILLRRPAELTPPEFLQSLEDLRALRRLEWREVAGQVYVRWLS